MMSQVYAGWSVFNVMEHVAVSMALDAEPGQPAMAPNMAPMQRAGFFICNARGLRFNNVQISNQIGPVLILNEASDVEVSGGLTGTPDANAPVIHMRNVGGAFIHGCRAPAGTETFLYLEGQDTREIVLAGNGLRRAGQPVQQAQGVCLDALADDDR